MEAAISENGQEPRYSVHPHKFMLWLAIGGMVMLFAAFTSAYVVRRSAGNWLQFQLPTLFWWSTVIIALSSGAIQLTYRWAKQQNPFYVRFGLSLTILLGLAFSILQYQGWQVLTNSGFLLGDNPSVSFVYVITGVHVVHVLGGLVMLFLMFVRSLRYQNPFQKLLPLRLTTTYWHFVDGLWIYLFFFLLLYR